MHGGLLDMDPGKMPHPRILIDLEPEEIGMLILTSLSEVGKEHPQNFCSVTREFREWAEDVDPELIQMRLFEGWGWLVAEGLITPVPDGSNSGWCFVSRRGRKLKASSDLREYLQSGLLSRELDQVLEREVKPLFIRGSLDASVFQAYKEVEIRMREAAGLGNEFYGKNLVVKCLRPTDGILVDQTQEVSERESLLNLFLGSVGLFKNPHSHRNVDLSATEASTLINFADYLLKLIDARVLLLGQSNPQV